MDVNQANLQAQAPPVLSASVAAPNAGAETDGNLLVLMGWASDHPAEAREAFREFHGRHARFLYLVCKRKYACRMPNHYDVKDLVGDTLVRVFEKAATFDSEGLTDPDRLRRLVRRWILKIASNILMDVYRGRPTAEQSVDPEFLTLFPESEPPEETALTALVTRAIREELSDREAEVIRITFQWYRVGEKHQRLPNDVAADLAAELGTSPENLRKIRQRAITKIEQFLRNAAAEDLLGK